jgi:hypothetical protein
VHHPSFRTSFVAAAAALSIAGCASSSSSGGSVAMSATPALNMSTRAPSPDPRVGLKAGWWDFGEATWNLKMISTTKPSDEFRADIPGDRRLTNTDLAFSGNYVFQGNYSGFQIWDIANPRSPKLVKSYVCPGSQSDVSVVGTLMFVSHEATTGRVDCGLDPIADAVSSNRARGVRIYDIKDIKNPKRVAMVQTCRGSHTHTVVTDPNDTENVYIYVSGSAGVRSAAELAGCSDLPPEQDPNSARFRIEVIQVPLKNPAAATIVSSPRIFTGLTAPARHADPPAPPRAGAAAGGRGGAGAAAGAAGAGGRGGRGGAGAAAATGPRPGPNQCHDITVYPAIKRAGGACGGYGLLLDISDVKNPRRIGAAADSNFAFWHSATFSNDGKKVLFTDEWGGGTAPRCRVTDKPEWGANALFTLENDVMTFQSYYKLPAAQTNTENCVAHNGSLIPVPGRDLFIQGWYQGGISLMDWTDIKKPVEIAYHDRGPINDTTLVSGGSWSVYWYNGMIINSEIARGLDIFELVPSGFLTQNEIDAAKTVTFRELNVQEQPLLVWPPSFAKARAFVDQLERSQGLSAEAITSARMVLGNAERARGGARSTPLVELARGLTTSKASSRDAAKVQMLIDAVNELAR